jgi:hypothetical protein
MITLNIRKVTVWSLFIVVIFLSGCESSVVKPEEAIAKHPEWDEQTITYIREGLLIKGMTKEQVRASWGAYCETCQGTKKFEWGETWEYPTQVVFFDKTGKMTKFVAK